MDDLTGLRVRIVGLKSKPQLNGKCGFAKSFNADTWRYNVTLDDGSVLALKQEVLERALAAPEVLEERTVSVKAAGITMKLTISPKSLGTSLDKAVIKPFLKAFSKKVDEDRTYTINDVVRATCEGRELTNDLKVLSKHVLQPKRIVELKLDLAGPATLLGKACALTRQDEPDLNGQWGEVHAFDKESKLFEVWIKGNKHVKIWLGCDSLICITAKQNDFKQAPPKLGSLAHEIYVRNMEEREERERQKASAERYCQAFELVPLKEKVAHCRFFIEKFTKEVDEVQLLIWDEDLLKHGNDKINHIMKVSKNAEDELRLLIVKMEDKNIHLSNVVGNSAEEHETNVLLLNTVREELQTCLELALETSSDETAVKYRTKYEKPKEIKKQQQEAKEAKDAEEAAAPMPSEYRKCAPRPPPKPVPFGPQPEFPSAAPPQPAPAAAQPAPKEPTVVLKKPPRPAPPPEPEQPSHAPRPSMEPQPSMEPPKSNITLKRVQPIKLPKEKKEEEPKKPPVEFTPEMVGLRFQPVDLTDGIPEGLLE